MHFERIVACVRAFGRLALVNQSDNDGLITALGQLVDGLLLLEFALIIQKTGLLHDALGKALQFRESEFGAQRIVRLNHKHYTIALVSP